MNHIESLRQQAESAIECGSGVDVSPRDILTLIEQHELFRDNMAMLAHRLKRRPEKTELLDGMIRICEEHGYKPNILRSEAPPQ